MTLLQRAPCSRCGRVGLQCRCRSNWAEATTPEPAQRCEARNGGYRCAREREHEGLHDAGFTFGEAEATYPQ